MKGGGAAVGRLTTGPAANNTGSGEALGSTAGHSTVSCGTASESHAFATVCLWQGGWGAAQTAAQPSITSSISMLAIDTAWRKRITLPSA